MVRVTLTCCAALWAALAAPVPDLSAMAGAPQEQSPAADAYERGQELIRAGNPEGALVLWTALQDSLWETGAEDPRIGVAFVQTVAEYGLDEYREVGSQIFNVSFSGRTAASEAGRDEILAEGRRTFALMDSVLAAIWLRAGESDPGMLARTIKRFWVERDPTPTTTLNERLFEHWERVVHARRNYVYNRSSPYRTDDRGIFYVKYGEPDRIVAGTLTISAFDRSRLGVSIADVVAVDLAPRYEIWRYANIDTPNFTYFLFGNVDQTGPFEYVKGLSDILGPNVRTQRINGMRAQYYLEYFYYIELGGRMGGPYGDRLAELESLWGQARLPPEGVLEARSADHALDDTREAQRPKVPSHSEFDDSRKSALSAQVARVMVDQEPRLLLLAVSSPLWRPTIERGELGGGIALAPFSASHTVVMRDQSLNEIGRASMVAVDEVGEITTVQLRHLPQIGHLTVAAEHVIEGQDLEDAEEVGVLPGHRHFAVGPLLRRDSVALEVSDLIVGIPPESIAGLDGMPLPLLPATQFSRADPVRVFFDIYQPTGAEAGETAPFNIRVLVFPFTSLASPEELLRTEGAGRTAITLAVESEAPTSRHYFDLDLRNETPGLQQLVLEVTDPRTGASRVRAVAITLLAR